MADSPQQVGFIGGKNPFSRRPQNWTPISYQDVLDDWQSRVQDAPVFNRTFEGVNFNTPERQNLINATDQFVNTVNKVGGAFSSGELMRPSSRPDYGVDLKNSAENFRDAFIANSEALRSRLGNVVQPVNNLLSEFFRVSPGANQDITYDLGSFRHELYSHLYPYKLGLSPDYRTFQAKNRIMQASPILPFNEAVAEYTDRVIEGIDPNNKNYGRAVAGLFHQLAEGDAKTDNAFNDPEVMKMWESYHNFNPTEQQRNQISSTFDTYKTKYIEPVASRYKNLVQGIIPEQFWKVQYPYSSPVLSADSSLSGSLSRANNILDKFGIPGVFDKNFIGDNYLFSQDPFSTGLREIGKNTRGAMTGAAVSALNPDVAKAVDRGDYRTAAQTVARDVVAGAATQGGVEALAAIAPRVGSVASGALNIAGPILTGAALFNQGRPGSLTDVVTRKLSQNYIPGTPVLGRNNPKTDIGARSGHAINNELKYAGGQLRKGMFPYLNVPIPFFRR